MTSTNRRAEPTKNTPPELFLSTRLFRLFILQRLILDDFTKNHSDLLNVVRTIDNTTKIADDYKIGALEEFEDNSFDANNISLYAAL